MSRYRSARRGTAYISSARACTNWSMPCRRSFWGKVLGVPSQIRRSARREHRLTYSLTCLYRRAVSPSETARQKSSKPSKRKFTSRLKLPAFNNVQWRREFSFYGRVRVLDAITRANKVNANFTVYSSGAVSLFIDTIIDRLSAVSKFSGALFFAPMNNTRMEFQITHGACANVSNRIKEGELPRPASPGFD